MLVMARLKKLLMILEHMARRFGLEIGGHSIIVGFAICICMRNDFRELMRSADWCFALRAARRAQHHEVMTAHSHAGSQKKHRI